MANQNAIKYVIFLAVALMVVATILPLSIGLISGAGDTGLTINGSATTLGQVADPTVVTLIEVLLPIVAVIGVILYFLPRMRGE